MILCKVEGKTLHELWDDKSLCGDMQKEEKATTMATMEVAQLSQKP
jgi:hypothetical protein